MSIAFGTSCSTWPGNKIISSDFGYTFNFDSSSTTSTGTEHASLVNATLQSYNTSDLQSFNQPFRHSKILRLIDETDTAILNNTTTVTMAKKFSPTLSTATSYNINFNNRNTKINLNWRPIWRY